LDVGMQGPGMEKQIIPSKMLYQKNE
jgi:hypothetical protein